MSDADGGGVLALYMQNASLKIGSILAMAAMSGDNPDHMRAVRSSRDLSPYEPSLLHPRLLPGGGAVSDGRQQMRRVRGNLPRSSRSAAMAELRGKFISLACRLLQTEPHIKEAAQEAVVWMTGEMPGELEPEGWYDTQVLAEVLKAVETHSTPLLAWATIKVIGQNVYPLIKATTGLPQDLRTPVDFLAFEAQGFLCSHRGADVVPRKFMKLEDGHVVVEALSPGYSCVLIEGVFEGILRMCSVRTGRVTQPKCVLKGDPACVYEIQWPGASAVPLSVHEDGR